MIENVSFYKSSFSIKTHVIRSIWLCLFAIEVTIECWGEIGRDNGWSWLFAPELICSIFHFISSLMTIKWMRYSFDAFKAAYIEMFLCHLGYVDIDICICVSVPDWRRQNCDGLRLRELEHQGFFRPIHYHFFPIFLQERSQALFRFAPSMGALCVRFRILFIQRWYIYKI